MGVNGVSVWKDENVKEICFTGMGMCFILLNCTLKNG